MKLFLSLSIVLASLVLVRAVDPAIGKETHFTQQLKTNATAFGWRGDSNLQVNVPVNVKWYGAKGDGTTDDSGAFQAAMIALASGGRLIVPPGTNLITSTITVPGGVTIQGMSEQATVIRHTGNNVLFKAVDMTATVNARHFSDMTIVGNSGASAVGIELGGVSGCSVERVGIVSYANGYGIKLNNPADNTWTEKTLLMHVGVTGCKYGFAFLNVPWHPVGADSMSETIMVGCHVSSGTDGTNRYGIYQGAHTFLYGGYLNCKFNAESAGFEAVHVEGSATAQGNQVHMMVETLTGLPAKRLVVESDGVFAYQGEFLVLNEIISDDVVNNANTHFGTGFMEGRWVEGRVQNSMHNAAPFHSVHMSKTTTNLAVGQPLMLYGTDQNTNGVYGMFGTFDLSFAASNRTHHLIFNASTFGAEVFPAITVTHDESQNNNRIFKDIYFRYNSNTFTLPTLWVDLSTNFTTDAVNPATLTVSAVVRANSQQATDLLGPVPGDLGTPFYAVRYQAGDGAVPGIFVGPHNDTYLMRGDTNRVDTIYLRASQLQSTSIEGVKVFGNNANHTNSQGYVAFYNNGSDRLGYVGKASPLDVNMAVGSDVGNIALVDSGGFSVMSGPNGRLNTFQVESLRMTANGVDRTNSRSFATWYDPTGFIRMGYVGKPLTTDADIYLVAEQGGLRLMDNSGGIIHQSAGNTKITGSALIKADGTTLTLTPSVSNNASLLVFNDDVVGAARGSIGFASNGDTNLTVNVNNGELILKATTGVSVTNSVFHADPTKGIELGGVTNTTWPGNATIPFKSSFATNFTVSGITTNFFMLNGTNQLITLPSAASSAGKNYRFSMTNGHGSFVITNSGDGATLRDGVSLSYTNIGVNHVGFLSDGSAWWLSTKGHVVMPSASWSLTNTITPVQDVITNIPFTNLEFNNSQGLTLKTNAGWAGATQLWITNAGTYMITFSAVLKGSGGGSVLSIWLRQAGADVPRTRTDQGFTGATAQQCMTVNYFVQVGTSPTYFEMCAASHDASPPTIVSATPNPTGYTAPAMPGVIVTINRVSDTWP